MEEINSRKGHPEFFTSVIFSKEFQTKLDQEAFTLVNAKNIKIRHVLVEVHRLICSVSGYGTKSML